MVEVSKLRSLDIYTNTGHYVGRVEDVVLNIRLGTISKLQVRAIEQERRPTGFVNQFLGSIRGESPEDNDMRSFQNDVLTVDCWRKKLHNYKDKMILGNYGQNQEESMKKGYLVLQDGRVFEGIRFGAEQDAVGEMVFNTSAGSFIEILHKALNKDKILPKIGMDAIPFCIPVENG